MKKIVLMGTILLLLTFFNSLLFAQEFRPDTDGWYFGNWGEASPNCIGSCKFSWELYRKTYLGINPTYDCVEAPLDCAFYEIFKTCAEQGNCGGMSLLSLSIFKEGGYMGFCCPAKFYTGGDNGPDREDLHRAINIMQARQFSAHGIENFINVVDAGNLNNADAAFECVKGALARGDYPLISIANGMLGDNAHTVIPYRIEEHPSGYPAGTKIMHIWDSNHPYDTDSSDYSVAEHLMIINGPTNWTYRNYSGSNNGWCFCIPMSLVKEKARQPIALDLVITGLVSIFVHGTGSAVAQITDDEGHRLYKDEADTHLSWRELETDPAKRLKGAVRWPRFDQAKPGKTPEIYFIKRSARNSSPVHVTLSGAKYEALISYSGNLIRVKSESSTHGRDLIKISGLASPTQSLQIKTTVEGRKLNVSQLRTGIRQKDWRCFSIINLNPLPGVPVYINMEEDAESVVVSSREKKLEFEMDVKQSINGKLSTRKVQGLSVSPGQVMKIAPKDWKTLEHTEIYQEIQMPKSPQNSIAP